MTLDFAYRVHYIKPMPTTIELKCRLCKHTWEPRRKNPKACPKCKRYDWRLPEEVKA